MKKTVAHVPRLRESRSELAARMVEEKGMTLTEAGARLGISPSAVLMRIRRNKANKKGVCRMCGQPLTAAPAND